MGITNVKLQEVAYFSPYDSNSKTFQKVYILKYNNEITNYDQYGIEKIYYMTKEEIKALMNNKPDLLKTDYFVVMEYLFDKKYL